MNILAHLHLATLADSSLIGNSVADFVKGDPYLVYPLDIADGIMLHRRIDTMIDNLAEVKYAKSLFRKTHQRVAPITLDIVWDHFLSKHWNDYCVTSSVTEFNHTVQQQIQPYIHHYPSDYQHFMNAMWRGKWLENYSEIDFIGDVLSGMASRRPKLFQLKETIVDIHDNYAELQSCFIKLYPKMYSFIKNNAHF